MKAGHDWFQVGLTRRRPGNGIEQKGGCQELGVGSRSFREPLQGEQIEWTSHKAVQAQGESLRGISCRVTNVIKAMKGWNGTELKMGTQCPKCGTKAS